MFVKNLRYIYRKKHNLLFPYFIIEIKSDILLINLLNLFSFNSGWVWRSFYIFILFSGFRPFYNYLSKAISYNITALYSFVYLVLNKEVFWIYNLRFFLERCIGYSLKFIRHFDLKPEFFQWNYKIILKKKKKYNFFI